MRRSRQRAHVAVLGAGIMGSCLALFLARKGMAVSLFDMEAAPMSGASRWNEGKIHLGYLYAADQGLSSARHLIPGGLAFGPLMSSLLEQPLCDHTTHADDIFLIHRNSVVQVEQARHYYQCVNELVRNAPGANHYLADVRNAGVAEISHERLNAIADPALVQAGFEVPERSVQTNWIADQLCGALQAETGVIQRMNTRVFGVTPNESPAGPWQVSTGNGREPFSHVVNALWHGRIDIDRTAGIAPGAEWSNRYRLSLFVRTTQPFDLPSAVLAVGPYGDIKNYNGRDFYLSWYPAGLIHESENTSVDLELHRQPLDRENTVAGIRAGLNSVFRGTQSILDNAEDLQLAGGYVFAQGRGSLASPASSLHRRDRFGVSRHGRYYSIDTGKYSIAPWLAESVAGEIMAS